MNDRKSLSFLVLPMIVVTIFIVTGIDVCTGGYTGYEVVKLTSLDARLGPEDTDGKRDLQYFFTVQQEDGEVEECEISRDVFETYKSFVGKNLTLRKYKGGITGLQYKSDFGFVASTPEATY